MPFWSLIAVMSAANARRSIFMWASHAHRAYALLARVRSRGLRFWFACILIPCILGVYGIEATHHHETQAEENACAICHVVNHQPLDLGAPPLGIVFSGLVFLFYILSWQPTRRVSFRLPNHYRPRAPPLPR